MQRSQHFRLAALLERKDVGEYGSGSAGHREPRLCRGVEIMLLGEVPRGARAARKGGRYARKGLVSEKWKTEERRHLDRQRRSNDETHEAGARFGRPSRRVAPAMSRVQSLLRCSRVNLHDSTSKVAHTLDALWNASSSARTGWLRPVSTSVRATGATTPPRSEPRKAWRRRMQVRPLDLFVEHKTLRGRHAPSTVMQMPRTAQPSSTAAAAEGRAASGTLL